MTAAYKNLPSLEFSSLGKYRALIVDCTVSPPIVKPGTIADLIDWDSLDTYGHDVRIGPIQWRPNAIHEKYTQKAKAALYSARAKCHNLQKKLDKINITLAKMMQREDWEKVNQLSGQAGEIVDEQYYIMQAARKTKNEYSAKINSQLEHQRTVFEQLSQQYLLLMGKTIHESASHK